jgi:hypothetical protein
MNERKRTTRKQRRAAIRHLKKSRKSYQVLVDEIRNILRSRVLTSIGKIEKIEELITKHDQEQSEQEDQKEIKIFEETLDRATKGFQQDSCVNITLMLFNWC